MSDAKYPNPVNVAVARAMCSTLLEHIIEPMRLVARDAGYAITVHGSLARDIDLVAIPWTERADDPDFLVARLCAVVAGITGRCNQHNDWVERPHGRRAKTILVWGPQFGSVDIDLSIMPRIEKEPKDSGSIAQKPCKTKRKSV